MKPGRLHPFLKLSPFGVLLPLIVLGFLLSTRPAVASQWAQTGQLPQATSHNSGETTEYLSAKDRLERAWNLARDSGSYRFTATVRQQTVPQASPANVGRQSRQDQLYLDGRTNLEASQLEMTLWQQGGTILDPDTGVQVRIEGDQAYTRQGQGDWQPIADFTGLFAPGGDFLTYLAATRNVNWSQGEILAGRSTGRYAFEIDGPGFARYMRDQLQIQMMQQGELPPGIDLDLPKPYRQMTGSGELWVDQDGLPLRQVLHLELPGRDGDRIMAEISVEFSEYGRRPSGTADALTGGERPPVPSVTSITASLVNNRAAPALLVGLIVLMLLFVLLRFGSNKKVYASFMSAVIVSMLLSPLMQSAAASGFFARQLARQQEQEAQQQESDLQQTLREQSQAPVTLPGAYPLLLADQGDDTDRDGRTDIEEVLLGTDPGQAARLPGAANLVPLPPNDGKDQDGDGLTDYLEVLLGTLPDVADTDGDNVNDFLEVSGFTAGSTTFYTDPLQPDTNRDGIDDGREWFQDLDADGQPDDTDSDGQPDLVDSDNDNDGVPDSVDFSPFSRLETVFSKEAPFELEIENLTPGQLTYVEFQIRPQIASHLWYAYNIYDWPDGDLQGNIQDQDGVTFYDLDPSLPPVPNDFGDIQLVPMIELRLSSSGDQLPPQGILDRYGIVVNDDRSVVYLPLQLATDPHGKKQVAFQAKMLYLPGADWGEAHQVRLVWAVQMLNDDCQQTVDGQCEDYGPIGEHKNKIQLVHVYYDEWKLTGIKVQENHGAEMAAIYEDPSQDGDLHDDKALWLLSAVLEGSFLNGRISASDPQQRDPTASDLYARLNHSTNGTDPALRWEIPDILGVQLDSYDHSDEMMITTAATTTLAILDGHFTSYWSVTEPITPTIMFASENRTRSINLDEMMGPDANLFDLQGNRMTLNLDPNQKQVQTFVGLTVSPYSFNGAAWHTYPVEAYWDELGRRYAADAATEYPDPDAAAGFLDLLRMIYLVMNRGIVSLVQEGDLILQKDLLFEDAPIGAKIAKAAGLVTVKVINVLYMKYLWSAPPVLANAKKAVENTAIFGRSSPKSANLSKLAQVRQAMLRSGATVRQINRLIAYSALLVFIGVAVGAYFLAKEWLFGDPSLEARIVTGVIVGAALAYLAVIQPLLMVIKLTNVFIGAGLSTGSAFLKALGEASEMVDDSKLIGMVGLVISIGIVWGIFIYEVLKQGISPGSVAFNMFLAQVIAATILNVVLFVLSLTLFGTILVGLITLIDAILLIADAGFTITEEVTEAIAKAIYHFELTIDQDVQAGGTDLDLVDPDRGMVEGVLAQVSIPITTTITHKDPDDGRLDLYLAAYYTASNLRSTTFQYELSETNNPEKVGRDEMRSQWEVRKDHKYIFGHQMYRATAFAEPSINVLLQAGVNHPLPDIFLLNSFALPGVECWNALIGHVCVDKSIRDTSSNEVGSAIILDILPDTLDEFVALDWGGAMSFAQPQDADGDGLLAAAAGGVDPDDYDDDSDNDGLSDLYEYQLSTLPFEEGGTRLSLLDRDGDVDGLCDDDEIRLGTDPANPDTDGDGLDDGDEIYHQDRCDTGNPNGDTNEWVGGWVFTATYTSTANVTETWVSRISSDPLLADQDGDGLNDKAEKELHEEDWQAYPYHPRVFNETPLALYYAVSDGDRILGPGQSVTITTTVQNNLSDGIYALGGVTVTLPSILGGAILTHTFDTFQGAPSTVVANTSVDSAAASLTLTVDADFQALLHDGNTMPTFDWDPALISTDTALSGPLFQQSLTAWPTSTVPADYGLATLEGGTSDASVIFGGDAYRRAGTAAFGGALKVNPLSTGIVGYSEPQIVCNEDGTCIEIWEDATWYNCRTVRLDTLHVIDQKEDNKSSTSEFYIHRNGRGWHNKNHAIGEVLWSPGMSFGDGAVEPIGETATICEGDTIDVWEGDGGIKSKSAPDDYICSLLVGQRSAGIHNLSCSSGSNVLTLSVTVFADADMDWQGWQNRNCSTVYFDKIEVIQSSDGGNPGSPAEYQLWLDGHRYSFELDPAQPPPFFGVYTPIGTLLWEAPVSAVSGDDLDVNLQYSLPICRGQTIDIWEDDGDNNEPDYVCQIPFMDDSPAQSDSQGVLRAYDCEPGPAGSSNHDLKLHMRITANPKFAVEGRLLGPNGSPASGSLDIQPRSQFCSQRGFWGNCLRYGYRSMTALAAATDGTDFLVGYKILGVGLKVRRISASGGPGTLHTVAGADSGSGATDGELDLEWTDPNYLIAWRQIRNAETIYLMEINSSGLPLQSTLRSLTSPAGGFLYQPALAHNSLEDKTLLVYVRGNANLQARIIQGGVPGPEFTISGMPGDQVIYRPEVAYNALQNAWLVAWSVRNAAGQHAINYLAMAADGSILLPAQSHLVPGTDFGHLGVACTDDTPITPSCAMATHSLGGQSINLARVFMRSIPPWLGAVSGDESVVLTIDADKPSASVTSISDGQTLRVPGTLIIAGEAQDPSSPIAFVNVRVNGGSTELANGTESWQFAFTPGSSGSHTIEVWSTDVAGNAGSSTLVTVNVDISAPQISSDNQGDVLAAVQDSRGHWQVSLSGSASDGQGVQSVEALISPNGNGWQPAVLAGGAWSLDYVLAGHAPDGTALVDPSGSYTLFLRARDGLGNQTDALSYLAVNFVLENSVPLASLTIPGPNTTVISQSVTLSGVITDPGTTASGVSSLQVDLVPTGQISNTWFLATLDSPGSATSTWSAALPDLEGNYLINLRGTDLLGNSENRVEHWWSGWQGEIDTLAPRAAITVTQEGAGSALQTLIEAHIEDLNLTEDGLQFICPVENLDRGYALTGVVDAAAGSALRLSELRPRCRVNGSPGGSITLVVQDIYGHTTTLSVPVPGTATTAAAGTAQAASQDDSANGAVAFSPGAATQNLQALPALASTVLTPTHESTLTSLDPVDITGGAYAIDFLRALTMTVNGSVEYTTSWAAGATTDEIWTTTWTPPAEGVYTFVTVVEDGSGVVQTVLQPTEILVDTQAPTVSFDTTLLTTANRLSPGKIEVTGSAADNFGLENVFVSVDGAAAQRADFDGSSWRFVWNLGADVDGETHQLEVEAQDAGHSTSLIDTFTVDIVPPTAVTATLTYSDGVGLVPVEPGDTVGESSTLVIDWTASSDGSGLAGYLGGWTNSPAPSPADLTSFGPADQRRQVTTADEATAWFGHVIAQDANGNENTQSLGPVFVDSALTPDYIRLDDGFGQVYRGWMGSACSLIGADYRASRRVAAEAALAEVQRLYLTWDSATLRIAWTGADWDAQGDLFLYLDTGSGGSTAAYNPYGAAPVITLPDDHGGAMAADYLIVVEDDQTAELRRWSGSAWVLDQTLDFPNFLLDRTRQPITTDLFIPFSWIGSPSALKMVALASEEDALRLWATMPAANPHNSERAVGELAVPYLDLDFALTQSYQWSGPGSAGVCPSAGQFEDTALHSSLRADSAGVRIGFLGQDLPGLTPAGSRLDADLDGVLDEVRLPLAENPDPIGQGATVNYTLRVENTGSTTATGVTVDLTAYGGLTFASGGQSSSISIGSLPAGTSAERTFSASVDTSLDGESAEIVAVVSDNAHGAFDWLWIQHDIDTAGPQGVEIEAPQAYIAAGSTLIQGAYTDRSAVPTISLETQGGGTQTCADATAGDGQWLCAYDASGSADGDVIQLRARGTDIWGNTGSFGSWRSLTVDANPPAIQLSAETTANLSDGLLLVDDFSFSGSVIDDRQAAHVEICVVEAGESDLDCARVPLMSNGDFLTQAPNLGIADGETYEITFAGVDAAGNRSSPALSHTVIADVNGPVLLVDTHLKLIGQSSSPVTALVGSAVDGSGVASVNLHVTDPFRNFTIVPATWDGLNWSYQRAFQQAGVYIVAVQAVDTHGNSTTVGSFNITVAAAGVNLPPALNTGGPYQVDEGSSVTLTATAVDPNVGDTLTYAWDLDDDNVFESPGQSVTFDSLGLSGPLTVTVSVQVSDGLELVSASTTIRVLDAPPTADAGGPYAVDEGTSILLTASGVDPGGATLTFAWDLNNDNDYETVGQSVTFDAANRDGPDFQIVNVIVCDAGGCGSDSTTLLIDNVPPVPDPGGPYSVEEGGTVLLTGSAVDIPTDPITHTWDLDDDGLYETSGITTTFDATWRDGDDIQTVGFQACDDADDCAALPTDISILNRDPVVNAAPASQTIQYSDAITQVVITASDFISDPLTLTTSWTDLGTGVVTAGLPGDLSVPQPTDGCAGSGNQLNCTWTIAGLVRVPAGSYQIDFTVEDDDGGQQSGQVTLIVEREDSRIHFDLDNPVAVLVDGPGSDSSLPFSLFVEVQESAEVSPPGAPGDINLATPVTMTLQAVGPGPSVTITCDSLGAVTPFDYDAALGYQCDFAGLPVNTYVVQVGVNGDYYRGYAEDVLVVYDPSLGFTTGGGWFYWPGSEDPGSGYPGDKTNFGYTMKYNKKGTNIQGSLLLIRHLPDSDAIYRVKSNALFGLALGTDDSVPMGWATFSGKSNYLEPGWPEPIGNHTFIVYVEDRDQPGNGVDTFWIEVRDKDGLVIPVMSLDAPATDNAVPIQGGNIVVPH